MDKNGLTAHWYYSSGCNFACEFCYAFPRKIETKEIDEFKMIDSIKDAGFTFLVFTGEPLLRKKECLKVVRYACESGLKVGLDTNGILMDDSTLDFFKKYDVLLGFPIYSDIPQIHDQMVRMPSHRSLILSLLEKTTRKGIRVRINTMISRKNLDNISGIGELLKNHSVLYWNLIKFKPYGRGSLNKQEYDISEKEFKDVVRVVRKDNPLVNLVVRGGKDDSKCGYFIMQIDGKVVQPFEDEKERTIGDLTKETAKELLDRINKNDNHKKAEIEFVKNKGIIA